jgi:hypothetical protein
MLSRVAATLELRRRRVTLDPVRTPAEPFLHGVLHQHGHVLLDRRVAEQLSFLEDSAFDFAGRRPVAVLAAQQIGDAVQLVIQCLGGEFLNRHPLRSFRDGSACASTLLNAVCPHKGRIPLSRRVFTGSSLVVGRSPARLPELARVPSADAGVRRSVTSMDHSWLTPAALTLVMAVGPSAPAAEASSAAVTAWEGAAVRSSDGGAVTTTAVRGDVTAVVPGASIADDDHLPTTLGDHHSYRAVFGVWVAPNAQRPRLKIRSDGWVVRRCAPLKLQPGTDSFVTCEVVRSSSRQASNLAITLVVRTSNLGTYSRSFLHAVTK